jgi:Cytidine and deoxycytidylate deaminase zinc-binding region
MRWGAAHATGARDALWMDRALRLAEQGLGRTSPNPMVGAVLVKDGRVVGEGAHLKAGGLHAEAVALEAAGEAARGGARTRSCGPGWPAWSRPAATRTHGSTGAAWRASGRPASP